MRRRLPLAALMLLVAKCALARCEQPDYTGTFDLIAQTIFARHGCTDQICHGAAQSGGLDLRPGVAHTQLVDVASQTVANRYRVLSGQKEQSLLFLNLAAKVDPEHYRAPLRPMPPDPLPAVSADELELVRLWIEHGAPATGTIPGTENLVDACLPPPAPITIKPLAPPPDGSGVQLTMPPWSLGHGERQICQVTYIDLSASVPAESRSADGTRFRYRSSRFRQSPHSHHLTTYFAAGVSDTSPIWDHFVCIGGERAGQRCAAQERGSCGDAGWCAIPPTDVVGCGSVTAIDPTINPFGAIRSLTETASEAPLAPGVFEELPLRGLVMWDSHAFNLSDQPAEIAAWFNFDFATADEQQSLGYFGVVDSSLYDIQAPPFGSDEPCAIVTLPQHAVLYELSSHGHKRMKRWRTWLGEFRCQGGPNDGAACAPLGYTGDDLCAGAACRDLLAPHVGDCDGSGAVTVDEVLTEVSIALGLSGIDQCSDADRDFDRRVTVDEVLAAVQAALSGVPAAVDRDPEDSFLYLSTDYSDPLILNLDPPLRFDSARDEERTMTYCAYYDNGRSDPATVKRRSTSVIAGDSTPERLCIPTACAEGAVGEPCRGFSDEERDRSCDSSTGTADGRCDACWLNGGSTTDDEMFGLVIRYHL